QATPRRASDVLSKTTYVAPFDGVVTNLPVRERETVVIGIQNSPGSTLMTIADLSVITAEVKVDETDIVNVKIGQSAEVTIDAMPHPMARPSPEDKEEVQGVFVVRGKNAQFVPVKTGVTGTTDIEVKEGLSANYEIVTGTYKVLRTLKPGASVKINNEAPKKE